MQVNPLEAHVGYWLRYVSNHVSHQLNLVLAARDVTAAEWAILRELYEHEQVVPSRVAELLGMTRGAISKLIERLAAKQLVTRHARDNDRRFQVLALTAAGRALVPQLAQLVEAIDARYFGHLDQAQRAGLLGLLREVVQRHGMRLLPED